jgi:hypothetical protein
VGRAASPSGKLRQIADHRENPNCQIGPTKKTNELLLADHRNYYKVEKWTKAGRVERMLYAPTTSTRPGRSSHRRSSIGGGSG